MESKVPEGENSLDIDLIITFRSGKSDHKLLKDLEQVILTSVQDHLAKVVLLIETEVKTLIDVHGNLNSRKSTYQIE